MTSVEQIVRAAIPGASDTDIEHVLWGRTPFPFTKLTPRSLFKAASGWRRACRSSRTLCDHCSNEAVKDGYECVRCREALGA